MVSGWAVGSRAPSRRASRTRLSRPPADPAHAHRPPGPAPDAGCLLAGRGSPGTRTPPRASATGGRRLTPPAAPPGTAPPPRAARPGASPAPPARVGDRKVGRSGRGRGAPRTHSSTAASMVDRRSRPRGGLRSARGPLPASEPTETDRNHADPGWGEQCQAYPRRGQGHGLPSRRLVVRGRHGDGPPRDHPQRDLRELAEESLKRWSALRAARMASIAAAAPAIGHGEGNGAGQGHSSRQMTPWPVDASVLLADEGDDPNHADAGSCSEAPIRWPPWTSPVPRSRTWR